MMHYMRLCNEPFHKIKDGSKTVEMRLNDEKRSGIRKGDFIRFKNVDNDETVEVEVIEIYKFLDFEQLYRNFDKVTLGYEGNETANAGDMSRYYKKEDIENYRVLAIEVRTV